MASDTVISVIPCERCGNNLEDDYTFHTGFKKNSNFVTCDVCGERSHQLFCMDEVPEGQSVRIENDDAQYFIDDYFSESVGSPANSYKDEMKKGLEKHNAEQAVLRCLKCNATGSEQFIQMLDGEGCLAWWKCIACNEEYNQNGRLEPGTCQFRIRPCSGCQADDPNHFIIKECTMSKDIVLECAWCEEIHQTLVNASHPQVVNPVCKCSNQERDLFETNYDERSNVTKITCLLCYWSQDINHISPITCTQCNNCDQDRFQLIDNDLGQTTATICQCCESEQILDQNITYIMAPIQSKGSFLKKVKITSPDKLKMGDHIAFHRKVGYWHHAIVVDIGEQEIKLIEYTRSDNGPHIFEIKEHWVKALDWIKDTVYCIQYITSQCSSPMKVIERARQRIGEKAYNLFTNNCEHFASWAKTGQEVSYQVKEFTIHMTSNAIQWAFVNAAKVGSTIGVKAGFDLGIPYATEAIERYCGMAGLTRLDALAGFGTLVVQGISTGSTISGAYKDRNSKLKHIQDSNRPEKWKRKETQKIKNEFKDTAVGESAQALWQAGSLQLLFYGAQFLFPGSWVAGVIGATLGVALSGLGGSLVNKKAVDVQRWFRGKADE